MVAEVCDAEGHDDYDVYGFHTGAVLGLQLAIERPDLFEDIPREPVETIKRATLDNLAITFFSYDIVDRPFAALGRWLGRTPQATIVGDGGRVGAGLAAGINSQMASDSDFEEQGPGVHMFAPISAMALAVGEMVGASGREVITATALGYELNTRVPT